MGVTRVEATDELEHLLRLQLVRRAGRKGGDQVKLVGAGNGCRYSGRLSRSAPHVIDRPVADHSKQPLGHRSAVGVERARHARQRLEHLVDDVLALHLVTEDADGNPERSIPIPAVQLTGRARLAVRDAKKQCSIAGAGQQGVFLRRRSCSGRGGRHAAIVCPPGECSQWCAHPRRRGADHRSADARRHPRGTGGRP